MKKRSVGQIVRDARDALRMTQRQLADEVGIKPSHVAYIENGQRRPSLPLLRRIAAALDVNPRELLFLAHPEAKFLVGDTNDNHPSTRDAWREFVSNRALHKRYKITRRELQVLKQASMLEAISSPRNFLFILMSIRQSGDREPQG